MMILSILFTLFVASTNKVSAITDEDVGVMHKQSTCFLEQHMEREACDYSAETGENGPSDGDDRPTVPAGTMCMLNHSSGDITMLICEHGDWISSVLHGKRTEHQSRTKRWGFFPFIGLVGKILCALFCGGGSPNNLPPNSIPTIYCPTNVPNIIYTEKYKITANVPWSPATAKDQEDGYIEPTKTQGKDPGSEHSEGTHTVTYQAKDSRQAIATCSFHFTVKVHRCPIERTNIRHGTASCKNAPSKDIYGSICDYTCDPGYVLTGSQKAECMQNEAWDSQADCRAISCGSPTVVIEKGRLICQTQDYTYQSQCIVNCDTGYNIEGNDIVICQASKTWTVAGKCVDRDPPQILCGNDIEVFAGPKRSSVAVILPGIKANDNSGLNVTVTCDHATGSLFDFGLTRVTCIAIDAAKNNASCSYFVKVKEKQCLRLEPPANSDVMCSHMNTYGSECTIICRQAYELAGNLTRICQENQAWSGREQSCVARNCTAPPTITHGYYECLNGTTYQSSCPLRCNNGYTPEAPLTITCNINVTWTAWGHCKDHQPPSFPDGCTADMSVTAAGFGEPTYVFYKLPRVTDNSGENVTAVGDPPSGYNFDVGVTVVTVRATDSEGNSANCSFIILVTVANCSEPRVDRSGRNLIDYNCSSGYSFGALCSLSCNDKNPLTGPNNIRCVKSSNSTSYVWSWPGNVQPYCDPKTCKKLDAPQNGALGCDSRGNGSEMCVVFCNEKFMYPYPTPLMYTCFKSTGTWDPSDYVPDCVGRRRPGSVSSIPDFYYYTGNCSSDNAVIKQNFLQAISSSQFKDLCTGDTACIVDNVIVTCGPITGKRRRKRSAYSFEIKISVNIQLKYIEFGSPRETLQYFNNLGARIFDKLLEESEKGLFTDPRIGDFDGIYGGDTKFNCQTGTKIVTKTVSCAGCGEGYMYENKTSSCVLCPRGTYQNKEISYNCTSCPTGKTTKNVGSTSVQQCQDLCPAGEFSETGMKPCKPCPVGSIQSKYGETKCDPCPYGMSTLETGLASDSGCQFFEFRMSENSSGPIIQIFQNNPRVFTISMLVHMISNSLRTTFDFKLGLKSKQSGTSYIALDNMALIINPEEDFSSRFIRRDYHVAIVYSAGNITLIVNGYVKESIVGVSMTDLWRKTFTFKSSQKLESVSLSHLQMTDMALTVGVVRDFSKTCSKRMDKNVLVVDTVDTSLITQNICDDIDHCVEEPCGQHGTCVDEAGKFSCVCDEPWSGSTCQIAPQFCLNHSCKNGAKCINQPEMKSYSCLCSKGYSGALCERLVVNGGWGAWSPWSICSPTCGLGQKSRSRNCDSPKPDPQGQDCVGNKTVTEACNLGPCPVDCRWGQWSAWACSSSCGAGLATQTRKHEQEEQYGGVPCQGPPKNTKPCELPACPVDGNVGAWAAWSLCSVPCGGGVSTRRRSCDNPPPSNGGKGCNSSQLLEKRNCSSEACPACKPLEPRGEANKTCITDYSRNMTECQIQCPKGQSIYPAVTNIFKCGTATNYTWTHQTADNPSALLPTCSDMMAPNKLQPIITITYDIDCNKPITDDIKTLLINALSDTDCKKTGKCDYTFQTSTTCNSKKRSTATTTVAAMMAVKYFKNGNQTYMSNKTDKESNETIQNLNSANYMIQEFQQKSSKVLNMTVRGVKYTGKIESQTYLDCNDGTGFFDGFCVDCAEGTYSNGNGACLYCDKGYYQDRKRSRSCLQCPQGKSTLGKGSYSANHCILLSEIAKEKNRNAGK